MARYNLSTQKTTGAAAGLLVQLRSGSARDLRVYEVGIAATTAVASTIGLTRPTAVGSGFTSTGTGAPLDPFTSAGAAVIDTAATTAPTNSGVYLRRFSMPATIGAGIIWTFPTGFSVPVSSALAFWQLSTAAVTYEVYFDYDE